MSEGPKKLKYPSRTPIDEYKSDDEHTSAFLQMKVLTSYMATEFLGMNDDKIEELYFNFGVENSMTRIREL